MGGSPRRRAVAWIWWLSVLAAASAAGMLVPLLLTLLLGLGFVGQVASWMEQASRHRWLIKTLETGVERPAALSHDRLLGATPPPKGSGVAAWLGFAGKNSGCTAGQSVGGPGRFTSSPPAPPRSRSEGGDGHDQLD